MRTLRGRRFAAVSTVRRRKTSASSVSRRGRRCAAWRRLGLDERRPGWLRVTERKLRTRQSAWSQRWRANRPEGSARAKNKAATACFSVGNGEEQGKKWDGVCVREAARKVWHGCSLGVIRERE